MAPQQGGSDRGGMLVERRMEDVIALVVSLKPRARLDCIDSAVDDLRQKIARIAGRANDTVHRFEHVEGRQRASLVSREAIEVWIVLGEQPRLATLDVLARQADQTWKILIIPDGPSLKIGCGSLDPRGDLGWTAKEGSDSGEAPSESNSIPITVRGHPVSLRLLSLQCQVSRSIIRTNTRLCRVREERCEHQFGRRRPPWPTRPPRSNPVNKKQLFVERRPEGDYAIRRSNSERASDVRDTQAEAIDRARELEPGTAPLVERVRHTDQGRPDKWRKP